jgi:hypothetical protein
MDLSQAIKQNKTEVRKQKTEKAPSTPSKKRVKHNISKLLSLPGQ